MLQAAHAAAAGSSVVTPSTAMRKLHAPASANFEALLNTARWTAAIQTIVTVGDQHTWAVMAHAAALDAAASVIELLYQRMLALTCLHHRLLPLLM